MPLTIAVIALALLVLVDLLLTFAILRRLREHEERLSQLSERPVGGPEIGQPLPRFETVTVDGGLLDSTALLGGESVVAVFSTSCHGCEQQAPRFVEVASQMALTGRRIITLLIDDGQQEDHPLRQVLSRAGLLVIESHDGSLKAAIGPQLLPSYYLFTAEGLLVAKAPSVDALPRIQRLAQVGAGS
jgi:hypothetical protein